MPAGQNTDIHNTMEVKKLTLSSAAIWHHEEDTPEHTHKRKNTFKKNNPRLELFVRVSERNNSHGHYIASTGLFVFARVCLMLMFVTSTS